MCANKVSVLLFFFSISLFSSALKAQIVFDISEDDLIESQWRYKEARHVESNTVIHQSVDHFDYAVYFQFDGQYKASMNGQLQFGRWNAAHQSLNFSFNGIKEFFIVGLSSEELILQYESPYTGQKTRYYFSSIEPLDSPFKGQINLLPKVTVDNQEKEDLIAKTSWWRKFLGIFKREVREEPKPYIRIEMTGGGYYGGINRVVKDYIVIDNKGTLIKEVHTEHNGLYKQIVHLDREMLLEFMDFVSLKGFFDLPRIIDCEDERCKERIHEKPLPVPLRLSITYGERTNIISVSIWGKDHYNTRWVDYPKEIDAIVFAIQNMAHQAM